MIPRNRPFDSLKTPFFKQPPLYAQRVPVEKLHAVVTGLERSPSAPLANPEKILPNIFLAQLIRRAVPAMLRQRSHRLEIDFLRSRRQASQLHVFDHSGT